jgi:hypothetical protein
MKEILDLFFKYVPIHCRKHEASDFDNPPIIIIRPLPEPEAVITSDFFSHFGSVDEVVEKLKEAIANNQLLENHHG